MYRKNTLYMPLNSLNLYNNVSKNITSTIPQKIDKYNFKKLNFFYCINDNVNDEEFSQFVFYFNWKLHPVKIFDMCKFKFLLELEGINYAVGEENNILEIFFIKYIPDESKFSKYLQTSFFQHAFFPITFKNLTDEILGKIISPFIFPYFSKENLFYVFEKDYKELFIPFYVYKKLETSVISKGIYNINMKNLNIYNEILKGMDYDSFFENLMKYFKSWKVIPNYEVEFFSFIDSKQKQLFDSCLY